MDGLCPKPSYTGQIPAESAPWKFSAERFNGNQAEQVTPSTLYPENECPAPKNRIQHTLRTQSRDKICQDAVARGEIVQYLHLSLDLIDGKPKLQDGFHAID